MASYVNTNVSSLNAQRRLTNVTNSLNTTYQRLSSGLRINSAKDDAAGLQISDRLTAHINGFNQGNRNASDGIALAQTAEGAMDEITNMAQRMRTLAVQASNGTLTSNDRQAISQEFSELKSEITRIACATTYGGAQILRGSASKGGLVATAAVGTLLGAGQVSIHVGSMGVTATNTGYSNRITLSFSQNMSASGLSITGLSVTGISSAEEAITGIDTALSTIDTARAKLGAAQNRLESTIRNQSSISENLTDARSRIRDTDYAEEASNLSQQSIIQQAATSMLTQANARPQIALSLLG
ncbi:flagellin [Succinivibrio dextrinosolvens]|uniref:flagellin N-terminal helical domain-containing protein n=1 Tax=Succinivibrio dextrinosolvens TaxID=83771 RepID=UPI0008E3523B|nr:flagellin [Succinivibrio dextrinosolvens]SFS90082.1 flagellin [Succinivibrio dextrinosolvens]